MKPLPKQKIEPVSMPKQRGVVLFLALIALLAMSLAAVALIRSVDTSTIIAGNISFKRSATTSGDAGVEAAITWLAGTDAANSTLNVLMDPAHPFNITGGAGNPGYYSNVDPTLSLTDSSANPSIKWNANDSMLVGTDSSGNTVRYVIQRMCRGANVPISSTNCLFSGAIQDNNGQNIRLPQDVCNGPGCPVNGQNPQIRITARTDGPKFTVSYVQAFVY